MTDDIIITQTNNWIKSVVTGCNFCPFAAKAMLKKSIHYVVLRDATLKSILETVVLELQRLDTNESIETTLIILPDNFNDFSAYLDMIDIAEQLMSKEKYNGIYQLASFHPEYVFADAVANDAANYTNRSIYPMLHILREESITKALENFKDPEKIPERNIDFARQKGLEYMEMLRIACMGNQT
ncbi:MAG: DUF1415 domain-containing protein [Chitinophagaceae bacterium]|nr:DUF1415 domain-containing protein [Chitinophagaceae bacterium]